MLSFSIQKQEVLNKLLPFCFLLEIEIVSNPPPYDIVLPSWRPRNIHLWPHKVYILAVVKFKEHLAMSVCWIHARVHNNKAKRPKFSWNISFCKIFGNRIIFGFSSHVIIQSISTIYRHRNHKILPIATKFPNLGLIV